MAFKLRQASGWHVPKPRQKVQIACIFILARSCECGDSPALGVASRVVVYEPAARGASGVARAARPGFRCAAIANLR